MKKPPIIEVLLATFNGERFISDQIDSILEQSYKNVRILARDDGSSDRTLEILRTYESSDPERVRILPTIRRSGSAKNCFHLLMKESTAGYVCFADQDDIWLKDKILLTKQAMDLLESKWNSQTPLLVFSDLRIVDSNLNTIHESFWKYEGLKPDRIGHLPSLLGQNVVTGCTAMVNRRLLELALRMPEEAAMHDRWIALLAAAMGKSHFIEERLVLYRQHDRNVVGVVERAGTLAETLERSRNRTGRLAQWKINQQQASALLKVHVEELTEKNRVLLNMYLRCNATTSRIGRLYIIVRYRFFRSGLLRNLATIVDLWTMRANKDDIT